MSAEDDLINLGVCIKQQAERVGVEHEGVPLEGVVVRIANAASEAATALSHISTRATAEYAEHVETVRRSESQRLYGHTGASAGVGQTEEGRTEALREAFLKFLLPDNHNEDTN